MHVTARLLAVFAFLAIPEAADAKTLTGPEIQATISNRTVEGDGWSQVFRADGSTTYTSSRGADPGSWEVRQDKYCSVWPPSEEWACYEVTLEGEAINFIAESGEQYPGRLRPP